MVTAKRSSYFLAAFLFSTVLFLPLDVFAELPQTLRTSYCDIHYSGDESLGAFFWRISGKRFDFIEDIGLARSRIDRLIDRVQYILDMYPDDFHVRIHLYPEHKEGKIAKYNHKTNTITVYADRVTDGILAHEIAHAVICAYFGAPPPVKLQEIIAQYVDRHLWDDY